LYSDQDVARLSLLRRATADGHSIGEIARLDVSALQALLDGGAASREPTGAADGVASVVADALGASERLDGQELERVLKRAVFALGVDRFVDEVVARFLTEVGVRWHLATLSPAHEHVASETVRRVLTWIGDAYVLTSDAMRIVIATPAGEMHELGALTVAAAAVSEGWRVVYLGPNLPARDIAQAAKQVNAHVVALSVVYSPGESAQREVVEVARLVPRGVDVVIGGAAAGEIEAAVREAGVRVLPGIDSLRRMLRAGRVSRAGDRSGDWSPDVR